VDVERATEPDDGSGRAGTFGNLFLEQGMRERVRRDTGHRGFDPRESSRARHDVDRHEPLVVVV
jgi:hypothetical protein